MDKKKIGEICKISSGGTPSRQNNEYYENGTIKWIKTGDLKNKNLYDASEYITEDALNNSSAKLFPPETVLIAMYGATIGACSILKTEAASNQACAALLPSEYYIPEFMYYYITFRKKDIVSKAVGGAQPNISAGFLKEYEIPLPPLETQKKIVEALDKAQDLIDARKEQIRLMDELVKSRFVEMFGDPIHPIDYIKMDEVAILERGRFSPRPRNDPKYYNGLYPFIQTGDIANCNHRLSEYKQTLNEQGIRVSKLFKKGTIVMAIVGATIGATAILQIQVYAPDSVIGITVKTEKCEPVFLETLLQFWKPELQRRAPESARANINLSILNEIPIIRADINEQIVFSKFVKQIDKSKSEMKKRLDEFITTHQALMQQYFG